ncbi:MAG: serine protease [bacterium]|nr:serine protease [bacterium]
MRSTPSYKWAGFLVAAALLAGACGNAPAPEVATDPFDAVAQLRGLVCDREMVGSAVMIDDHYLITVAHNVAGSDGGLTVTFEDGVQYPATLVGIDFDRDLALLRAPTVKRPILTVAPAVTGEGGRLIRLRAEHERAEVQFTDAEPIIAVGRNIYDDQSDVRRQNVRVTARAGSGYSGGPVLNDQNQMVGVVYAAARLDEVTYATASSEIDIFLDSIESSTTPVSDSGRCPT